MSDSIKPIFNYTLHRKVWRELARTGGRIKSIAFRKYGFDSSAFENQCTACEAALTYAEKIGVAKRSPYGMYALCCTYCPLEWGGYRYCYLKDSLFHTWSHEYKRCQRKVLARFISDLYLSIDANDRYEII